MVPQQQAILNEGVERLEEIKQFIHNTVNLEHINDMGIGFRLGLLISEVDDLILHFKTIQSHQETLDDFLNKQTS